jgi:hypothetical protein
MGVGFLAFMGIVGILGKEFAYEVPDSYGTGTGESCEGKCARIYKE